MDQRYTEFTYSDGLFGALIRAEGFMPVRNTAFHIEVEQVFWVEKLKIEGRKSPAAQTLAKATATKTANAKTSKTKAAQNAKTSKATTAKKAAPKRTKSKQIARPIVRSKGKSGTKKKAS